MLQYNVRGAPDIGHALGIVDGPVSDTCFVGAGDNGGALPAIGDGPGIHAIRHDRVIR